MFRSRTRAYALLIPASLAAFAIAWTGWEFLRVRAERPAIAWVEQLGGQVRCDGVTPTYDREKESLVINYDLDPTWPASWTAESIGSTVRIVEIEGAGVSDLSPLATLTDLEFVHLEDVVDLDLAPLANLRRLKLVMVRNGSIRDLSPLEQLDNLEVVVLDSTRIDRQQLAALKKSLPNSAICTFGKTW